MRLEAKEGVLRRAWLICIALLLAALVVGGLWFWLVKQPRSLLPASVSNRVASFAPYFYAEQIPAGYKLDEASISFDSDVLIVPLTKPGSPTIVLTEQPLPSELPEDLRANGNQVSGTVGPATINNISSRLVGIMIAPGPPETLVLLSTTDTNTAELIALLQGLKAVR